MGRACRVEEGVRVFGGVVRYSGLLQSTSLAVDFHTFLRQVSSCTLLMRQCCRSYGGFPARPRGSGLHFLFFRTFLPRLGIFSPFAIPSSRLALNDHCQKDSAFSCPT